MSDDQIKYLLTLPPEQIVQWYKSKGYTFSWNWKDVWQEAHSRSFTVAKIMKLDILQEIKDEVDKIFSHGITYEQFRKDLEPILKRLGWWGKVKASDVPGFDPERSRGIDPNKIVQLGSPSRLKTIYTTNANVAYSAGRYKSMIENVSERPYWLYNQIERKHKRKAHAYYANKVFMWNDPIWGSIFPPNGWFCGCYVTALTKAEVEARGLKVSRGEDFEIKVEEGWDYNPGKATFFPNPNEYDFDVAINWVRGGLTGPDFKEFFEEKIDNNFPIAILDQQYRKLIKAGSQTVFLSKETLVKNKSIHPELTFSEYQNIPIVVSKAKLIIQDGDQTLVFIKMNGKLYHSAIKATKNGKELYLTSFRYTSEDDLRRMKNRGKVVKNDL